MRVKILSCLVGHDDGTVIPYYCIEHEDGLWLVTAWLVDHQERVAVPERMIRVDSLDRPAKPCEPGERFDYVVPLLPKALIEEVSPDTRGFEVRNLPDSPVVDSRDLKPLPSLF